MARPAALRQVMRPADDKGSGPRASEEMAVTGELPCARQRRGGAAICSPCGQALQ